MADALCGTVLDYAVMCCCESVSSSIQCSHASDKYPKLAAGPTRSMVTLPAASA